MGYDQVHRTSETWAPGSNKPSNSPTQQTADRSDQGLSVLQVHQASTVRPGLEREYGNKPPFIWRDLHSDKSVSIWALEEKNRGVSYKFSCDNPMPLSTPLVPGRRKSEEDRTKIKDFRRSIKAFDRTHVSIKRHRPFRVMPSISADVLEYDAYTCLDHHHCRSAEMYIKHPSNHRTA
jgi:hypothetical protein